MRDLKKDAENNYFKIRNTVWIFLLKNKVKKFPLNLQNLADKNHWLILSYKSYCAINSLDEEKLIADHPDGFTIQIGKQFIICYNQNNNRWRNRFTIAHEIGHIILHKHIKDSKTLEKEANMFASRMLMPMLLVKELNIKSAEELSKLCDVSLESATIRLKRYNLIKIRKKFYSSKYEIKFLKQLKPFIETIKKESLK